MPSLRLPGARPPTRPYVRPGVWVRDVLLLDAHRRPTPAALLGLGALVVLAFVAAFVLGTKAPPATRGTAPRTVHAAPLMTSLRLDPVPALPDLRPGPAPIRSAPPTQAATAPPTASTAATIPPTTAPTPVAPQPVQPPVSPSPPPPVAKPKPSPGGQEFDSSG
jgi:hypothetical protein